MNERWSVCGLAFLWASAIGWADPARPAGKGAGPPAAVSVHADLEYPDSSFENASPLWYDVASDGTIQVHLLYDHERASPNRAAGHFHFRVHARAGAKLVFEFKNLDNVWNGKPGSVARELKTAFLSTDGRQWKPVHNDGSGKLHVSRPETSPATLSRYLAQMERLEKLLREHTWFTEGSTKTSFRNPGTLGDGLLARYGIAACIHELNANRIAGLDDYATAAGWKKYGVQLAEVFFRFFE